MPLRFHVTMHSCRFQHFLPAKVAHISLSQVGAIKCEKGGNHKKMLKNALF